MAPNTQLKTIKRKKKKKKKKNKDKQISFCSFIKELKIT
jgi:hypothetical protein